MDVSCKYYNIVVKWVLKKELSLPWDKALWTYKIIMKK